MCWKSYQEFIDYMMFMSTNQISIERAKQPEKFVSKVSNFPKEVSEVFVGGIPTDANRGVLTR